MEVINITNEIIKQNKEQSYLYNLKSIYFSPIGFYLWGM